MFSILLGTHCTWCFHWLQNLNYDTLRWNSVFQFSHFPVYVSQLNIKMHVKWAKSWNSIPHDLILEDTAWRYESCEKIDRLFALLMYNMCQASPTELVEDETLFLDLSVLFVSSITGISITSWNCPKIAAKMQYTAKRVNAKFMKTKVLPVASRRLFQNVMARRRFCCATIITKPSMNPTEKEVENRL